jgi:hypothetical protein
MISFPSAVLLLGALAGQGWSWPNFNEFKYWVSLCVLPHDLVTSTDP